MRLGFLAWCFPTLSVEEILKWGTENGFQCVGLDKWGHDIEKTRDLFAKYDIHIAALGTPVNILDPNDTERKKNIERVKEVILAAEALDVEMLDMFAGRDPNKSVEDNYPAFKKIMKPLVDFAAEHGRKLAIENCPMMHSDKYPAGTNIAFAPAVWERMFDMIPAENFGLTFDPAHCVWLGIDHIKALKDFKERVFYVHGKDCEIIKDKLAVEGILGHGWYRYRMPGWGVINWAEFISTLREIGFDGNINMEHEDVLFGFKDFQTNPDGLKEGLLAGKKYLSQYLDF